MESPPTKSGHIVIRVDATSAMGAGHLMRCLALAQALRFAGHEVTFVSYCENKLLVQRVFDSGFEVIRLNCHYPDPVDWQETSQILKSDPDAWLVLDGYHFDSDYQHEVKDAGHRLMVIDDTAHLDRYYGSIILNQNLKVAQEAYLAEPDTRFLLGPRYALLRSDFLCQTDKQISIPRIARKILVTMGGGDDENQTLQVVRAIPDLKVEGIEVVVVAGAANPNREKLELELDRSDNSVRLMNNAENMPELMDWADLAVCAGGTTCWELAFKGVPALVIILADNQRANAEGLAEEGVGVNLGWYCHLSRNIIARKLSEIANDAGIRARMSSRGRSLVDGKGSHRVLRELWPT